MIAFNEDSSTDEKKVYPLLESSVHDIFREHGYLQEYLNLEFRPEQSRLATEIAKNFKENQPLLCEAGTGVGKSLAYLLPGILHAIANNRKMLISAHTIALQEQIKNKDLQICKKLLNQIPELKDFSDFKYSLLIGRGNYLCNCRLNKALLAQKELFDSEEFTELLRIQEWAKESSEGIRQELSPPPKAQVWEWVTADSTGCNNKNCSPETCFYRSAKFKVNQSNLVILNHSLLFSLLNAGMSPQNEVPGILFPNDFVVLDEAHTIPSIATKHFGMSLSSYAIDFNLKTLYNPKTKRGLLNRLGQLRDNQMVAEAMEQNKEFFKYIGNTFLGTRSIFRVSESNLLDATALNPMRKLLDRLKYIYQMIDSEQDKQEIKEKHDRLASHIDGIDNFLNLSDENHVYWMERTGKKQSIVSLQSAPLDVSQDLQLNLFTRNTSACLTSATLSLQGNMNNFQKQTGSKAVKTFIENSPFNFDKSLRIYIAEDSPVIGNQNKKLDIDYLVDHIDFCIEQRAGGSLILFTSYTDMYAVADELEFKISGTGRILLVQGRDYSRSDLVKKFKSEGNAVLLGTDTFWTGIDIPGLALSQVIICRLPFENPSHPIQEAKCEQIQMLGLSPFNELMLPDALIKFKQGIGRLIRSHKDRGYITILDSRIVNKSYGRLFLECFPHTRYRLFNKENRKSVFKPK